MRASSSGTLCLAKTLFGNLFSHRYLYLLCAMALLLPSGVVLAQQSLRDGGDVGQTEAPPSSKWRVGAFVCGGFSPDYQIDSILQYEEELLFFTAGAQLGRRITSTHGHGFLRGHGEAVVEIDPLWIIYEPRQTDVIQNFPALTTGTFTGYKEYGAAVTPLLIRWNFQRRAAQRFTPWLQGGAGILWTSERFPQGQGPLVPHSNTSVINFTPQVGIGESFHLRRNSSIEMGARFIYVDSANLGEYDPGVDSLQFTLGYSWRIK